MILGPRRGHYMPDAVGIDIENLSKGSSGVAALDVARLTLLPRSTLALIGPSGCGKSTLLKLVVGLLSPDRGRIAIGGTPMTYETRRALQLRMGYVIQEWGRFPHLTAAGNTALVARDLGWPEEWFAARIGWLRGLTQIPPGLLARFPYRRCV